MAKLESLCRCFRLHGIANLFIFGLDFLRGCGIGVLFGSLGYLAWDNIFKHYMAALNVLAAFIPKIGIAWESGKS